MGTIAGVSKRKSNDEETVCVCCLLFLTSCAAIILHKRGLKSVFNPLCSSLTSTADREPQISVCNSSSSSSASDDVGEAGEAVGK